MPGKGPAAPALQLPGGRAGTGSGRIPGVGPHGQNAGSGAAGVGDGDHLRHRHPGEGGALHHGGGRLPGTDGCCLKGQGPDYFSS